MIALDTFLMNMAVLFGTGLFCSFMIDELDRRTNNHIK